MDHKSHGSPSFINIAVLLLFAVVISIASTATTYYFLNSKTTEQPPIIQPPVVSPVQTNVIPTIPPTSQTTTGVDETASWKMYKNTKVGFTVSYPERYERPVLRSDISTSPIIYADGTENDATIIFSGTDPDDNIFILTISPFTGNVTDLVENQKKQYLLETVAPYESVAPYVQLDSNFTTIDGEQAVWYDTRSMH